MKRRVLRAGIVIILALLYVQSTYAYGKSYQKSQEVGPGIMEKNEAVLQEIPENTEVLVEVKADNREENAMGELSVYLKGTNGSFEKQLGPVTAYLGRGGTGKVVEGDKKTPLGIFTLSVPFGISPKEESFPENYFQVTDTMYWDGDSNSDRYNRLVDTKEYQAFDKTKSEHLITIDPDYHYCLFIGYNPEGVPRKGSAIFLHCSVNENTAGCVAIAEEEMKKILTLYREGKTCIRIEKTP